MAKPSGELYVDLRLQLTKLQADVAKATRILRESFSKGFGIGFGGGGGGVFEKAAAGAAKLKTQMQAVAIAGKKAQENINITFTEGKLYETRKQRIAAETLRKNLIPIVPSAQQELDPKQALKTIGQWNLATQKAKAGVSRLMWSVGTMAQEGKTSLVIPSSPDFFKRKGFFAPSTADKSAFWRNMSLSMAPIMNPTSMWGNIIASRQIFSSFSSTRTGGNFLSKLGLPVGTAGAAAATGGVMAALIAVGTALKTFGKAIDLARDSIQRAFTTYTGAAQQGLSTRFFTQRQALSGLLGVQGNPNQVFMFGDAVSKLNAKIAPAVKTMSEAAQPLADTAAKMQLLRIDTQALGADIAMKLKPAIDGFVGALDALINFLERHAETIANIIKSAPGIFLGSIPGLGEGTTKSIVDTIMTLFEAKGASMQATLPKLMPFAKQIPASTWEHMGLVVGSAGMQDYARRTAVGVEKLVTILSRPTGYVSPAGVPRVFGMNPNVSNP